MSVMITEKDIIRAKNDATSIRDQIISAKSTMEGVLKNIESYKEELVQLGINPDKIDEEIDKMTKELDENFSEILKQINEWKEKMA